MTTTTLTPNKLLDLKHEALSSDGFKSALAEAGIVDLDAAFNELTQLDLDRVAGGRATQHLGRRRAIHSRLWKMQDALPLTPSAHPDTIFHQLTVENPRASRWHTLSLDQLKVVNETNCRVSLWHPAQPTHDRDVSRVYAFIPHGEYEHAQALLQQVEKHYAPIRAWFQKRRSFCDHDGAGWEHAIQLHDLFDLEGLSAKNYGMHLSDFAQDLPAMSLVEVVAVNAQMISYRELNDINKKCRGQKKRFFPCTQEEWTTLSDQIKAGQLCAAAFHAFMDSIPTYRLLREYPLLLNAVDAPTKAGGALDDAALLPNRWRYQVANMKIQIVSGQHAGAEAEIVDSFGLGRFRRIIANLEDGSPVCIWNSEATLKEASRHYNDLLSQGDRPERQLLLEIALPE